MLTMDLHASQIQGFFDVPVDHMYGAPILTPYFARKTEPYHDNVTVVSPDLGSVARAVPLPNGWTFRWPLWISGVQGQMFLR